jgi:hypothetical protein
MQQFREDLARATLDWARMQRDLQPVFAMLKANGIRVVPLKGLSYATTIYTVPAERPMSDADLLVRADDERKARDVLAELGYELSADPPLHHASTWVLDRQVIDLHTNVIGPHRSHIDLDAVWNRATDHLDPVDALVFHYVHIIRNRMRTPLLHVVDAARLAKRANGVDAALDRARSWGLHASVRLAHRFCDAILRDDADRPVGWIGPNREDIVLLREPSVAKKLAFDVVTAGSARQLIARFASYANRLRPVN